MIKFLVKMFYRTPSRPAKKGVAAAIKYQTQVQAYVLRAK